MYKYLIKPLLFLIPPEEAHGLTIKIWKFLLSIPLLSNVLKSMFSFENSNLQREVFGLHFKNPIGLAAGFDKDGKYFKEMAHLGFGFIEIGTVTPKSQKGNQKPRLFRLPEDNALINRMGFNNDGVDTLVKRLKNRQKSNIIIGGNLGKNKNTDNENAIHDYIYGLSALYDYVDYFVVNVSSPNTPGLRELQEKKPLMEILQTLKQEINKKQIIKPLLLKIAPDLNPSQLDDIVEIVLTTKTDGIIATNTTLNRETLQTQTSKIGPGGLSGAPLKNKSTEVIRYIFQKSKGKIPIIGVGGISCAKDVKEKMDAGASLVQIYTGLIYEGPGMVKKILKELNRLQ